MQISNSTGQSTSYRVTGGSGVTAVSGGDTTTSGGSTTTLELLESGSLEPQEGLDCCLGDSSVAAVEFYVGDALVATRSFASPPPQVTLMETAGEFWIDAPLEGSY